jgi:hypothetical protein
VCRRRRFAPPGRLDREQRARVASLFCTRESKASGRVQTRDASPDTSHDVEQLQPALAAIWYLISCHGGAMWHPARHLDAPADDIIPAAPCRRRRIYVTKDRNLGFEAMIARIDFDAVKKELAALQGCLAFPDGLTCPVWETLREDWLNAPTPEEQKRLAAEMQVQVLRDVPYVPLDSYFGLTCFRKDIVDIQPGWPVMHSVRRV